MSLIKIEYKLGNRETPIIRFLNPKHIIEATYVAAYTTHETAEESEDGLPHDLHRESHLDITTTENVIEPFSDFDGGNIKYATRSGVIRFTGELADSVLASLNYRKGAL
jgi:hypothetical protein